MGGEQIALLQVVHYGRVLEWYVQRSSLGRGERFVKKILRRKSFVHQVMAAIVRLTGGSTVERRTHEASRCISTELSPQQVRGRIDAYRSFILKDNREENNVRMRGLPARGQNGQMRLLVM